MAKMKIILLKLSAKDYSSIKINNIDEDKNYIPKTKKYNGFVLKPLYLGGGRE